MARLIIATALDQQAKRYAWLRAILFRLESWFLHLLWYGFGALSVEHASRFGGALVRVIGSRTRKRPWVEGNLGLAFPELKPDELEELTLATFTNIGYVAGEYPHLARIALENGGERLELVDHAGLEQYASRERGAVFFSGHLCNWEINALALARADVPVVSLYASFQNEHLDALMSVARDQLGCELVSRDASMRPVIKHLNARGSLGVLSDLRVDDGAPIPFLGYDMETSLVPARLALRHGCDVVPIHVERLRPGWFRATVDAPLELPETGTEEERAIALTRAMNARIEAWIRENPGEWLCTSRRWEKGRYPHKRALGHSLPD